MKFSYLNRCGFLLYHFSFSFSFPIWASCLTIQFILIFFPSSFYSVALISVCVVLFFHSSLTQLCHVTTLTCPEHGSSADCRPCDTSGDFIPSSIPKASHASRAIAISPQAFSIWAPHPCPWWSRCFCSSLSEIPRWHRTEKSWAREEAKESLTNPNQENCS